DFSAPGMDESAPVARLTAEQRESIAAIDPSDPRQSPAFVPLYGALKAECEEVVQERFQDRAAILRPGLIVGPHDTMDRFPYWVARVAEGGEVLAPGRPDRPVQIVDAGDLARWMIHLAERRIAGVFNATGPETPIPMAGLLDACREAASAAARLVW